jgi:hypothetical protein
MPWIARAWTAGRSARALAAGAALWLAGCAGTATDVRPQLQLAHLPQTFALESISNSPLPRPYPGWPDSLEIVAVTFTLHPDSTYTSRQLTRWSGEAGARIDTLALAGRFTRTGQGLVLREARTGDTAEFDVDEGGDVLRGGSIPTGLSGIDILYLHVYRRVVPPPV